MNLYEEMVTDRTRLIILGKRCKELGLRNTKLLKIVLKILVSTHDHLTIAQIHHLACGQREQFWLATIYRMINKMVVLDLIECHQFRTSRAYFKLQGKQSHDHLIDIDSGQIIEFRNSALDDLKEEIADKYGYEIDNSHIAFYAHPIQD